ncbi:hypothetical protein TNCV_935741 [Trichonephila clavipes]|nr:hypothetical protein TNCV_935741 [Trichonephila clavipes]
MCRVRSKNVYQHVSHFDEGFIAVYRDCGSSYRSIAAHAVEVQWLLAEYGIYGHRTVIRNAVLDLNGPYPNQQDTLRNPTFQQDNVRLHIEGIVRTFLVTENVQLLLWPARDLSPVENVWSMVPE